MNPYDIKAHSFDVRIVVSEFQRRSNWGVNLYDSDLPPSPDNKPFNEIDEAGMFGPVEHNVTFIDANGVHETCIAGLLVKFPDVAWQELSKKLSIRASQVEQSQTQGLAGTLMPAQDLKQSTIDEAVARKLAELVKVKEAAQQQIGKFVQNPFGPSRVG